MDKNSQVFVLKDKRLLGFAEYGRSKGNPVFYFHGFPGSRVEAQFIKKAALSHNIRLIAVDRPGMGLSTYQKNRNLLDWPDDVLELAKFLKINRFTVLGVSGGGPYALVCAYKLHSKILKKVIIVSGSGYYHLNKKNLRRGDKFLLLLASHLPWLLQLILWLNLGRNVNNQNWWEKNYHKLSKGFPKADQEIINTISVKRIIISNSIEGFKQGTKGLTYDFGLLSKPWGFSLKDIPVEANVEIFHGFEDVNVPITLIKRLINDIPTCNAQFFPGEGHFSLLINKSDEILKII